MPFLIRRDNRGVPVGIGFETARHPLPVDDTKVRAHEAAVIGWQHAEPAEDSVDTEAEADLRLFTDVSAAYTQLLGDDQRLRRQRDLDAAVLDESRRDRVALAARIEVLEHELEAAERACEICHRHEVNLITACMEADQKAPGRRCGRLGTRAILTILGVDL